MFDIDKMYIMFPNYKEVSGKLKYTSSEDDSKEAVQNKVIELYKSLILHQSNINKIMTPLDHEHVKLDAQNLAPAKAKSDLDNYEFVQDIVTKYSFLAGLAGVGQEANTSSDYAMGTMANIYLHDVYLGSRSHEGISLNVTSVNSQGEAYSKLKPHTKFDEIRSVKLRTDELQQWVDSYNTQAKKHGIKLINIEDVKAYESFAISDNISALMNAFVDIAKDPYITNVNWNMMTTNTGNMMLRAGVHPFVVMSFLAQPIIGEYIDFIGQYENRDKTEQTSNSKDAFRLYKVGELLKNDIVHISNFEDGSKAEINARKLYDIVTTYAFDLNKLNDKEFVAPRKLKRIAEQLGLPENHKFTEQDLNRIKESSKDILQKHSIFFRENFNDYVTEESLSTLRNNVFKYNLSFQAKTFNTFLEFQGFAKKQKASVDASKHGVNGMGKNTTQLLTTINRIENVELKGVVNYETKEKYSDGTPKLLSYYKQYNLFNTRDIVQNNPLLFVSSAPFVWNSYNQISIDIYGINLEDDSQDGLGDKLDKVFNTYLMSGFEPFNLTSENKMRLIESFPDKFIEFKNKYGTKYKILDELNIKKSKERKYIGLTNKTNSKEYTDSMINSWRELIRIHPEFGNDLVKYSFLTSGFNNTTFSFFQFIPPSFFFQNNFNGYVKEFTKYPDVIEQNFINHFYLANLNNSQVVKFVNSGRKMKGQPYLSNGITLFDKGVTKEFINVEKEFYKRIGFRENDKGETENLYTQYIKVEGGYAKIKSIVSDKEGGITINNFNAKKLSLPIDKSLTPKAIEYLNNVHQEVFEKSNKTDQSDDYNQEDDVVKENLTNVENIEQIITNTNIEKLIQSKTISELKEMFNNNMMMNIFNESGINNVNDLDTKSEEELGELLKKICK